MSKFKLEHGISKIRRTKLQSSIDQSIADDIEALAAWSNNETNYVVNELLRFALTQEEDFQKFKTSHPSIPSRTSEGTKFGSSEARPVPEVSRKSEAASTKAPNI